MKRRNFVRKLVVAPALPAFAAAAQQPPTPSAGNQQQPQPQPITPARQVPRQPQNIPTLKVTSAELAAESNQRFFSPDQFATLRQLGAILVPPVKTSPGALDAQAPEFLDFLLSVSPAGRQAAYRQGLDALNAQAKQRFGKPFAEIAPSQADTLLRPLLTIRPWPQDLPNDPMQSFLSQVHEDLRTATHNSREWVAASEKSGHRFFGRARSMGMYWAPIDPIIEA